MDKGWLCALGVTLAGCGTGFTQGGDGEALEGGGSAEGGSGADVHQVDAAELETGDALEGGDVLDVHPVDAGDAGELEAGALPEGGGADVDGPRPLCCVDYAPGAPAVACGAFQCGHAGSASSACPSACVVGASSCWPCAPGYGGPGQPACNLNPSQGAGNVAYCE